ncbi:alanine--tRNA ligase-related protein [Nocardia sp. NPDC059246]|uniref:alanine--tRNA ligase-related protein n=1 Tax=unclassified Nocardia TaxID=2637762 RepID=UPI0036B18A11
MITTDQTVRTFLEFFRERGHELTPAQSLIPPPGDSVLFTTSGMHPLTPYLEGRPHPLGQRLTGLQRCLRTTDLDEVGDETHLMPRLWPSLDEPSVRLVSDHLRSGIVIVGDRIVPSPNGRGHVLRRLIRRVLTTLWRDDPTRTLSDLPVELIDHTLGHFGQPRSPREVRTVLLDEERKFLRQLDRGRKVLSHRRFTGSLAEGDYRYLHETHGLPRDLVEYLGSERRP